MKLFLPTLILIMGFNTFANELTCYTDGANGVIKLTVTKPSEYYNGVVKVSGSDLLNHLRNMISGLHLPCDSFSCSMNARIDLKNKTVFVAGRHEPGLLAYPEGNGLKLFNTYDGKMTGSNWFFNNCR